jgi:geranylgeranyl pyrophosphate synthase
MAVDALAILARSVALVDGAIASLPNRHATAPPKLVEAIQYSLTAGGKRLRPALVLETARACGATSHGVAPDPSVLAAAVAVELVHTFSLVHDDLPAMDDDDLRRGRPTSHKVFGEAMAILVGDAMLALAFDVLATDASPAVVPPLVRELARATGPLGMIGGQVLDIEGETKSLTFDQLKQVHAMKTGALLTASCRCGAIAAGASDEAVARVTDFGRHLGLAFQIVDDVLDVTSTPEQLGKATNKDTGKGKNTYPRLLGLGASRAAAADELRFALDALSMFDERADGLRAIAQFVVDRRM